MKAYLKMASALAIVASLSACASGYRPQSMAAPTELGRDYILVWGVGNLPARDGFEAQVAPELTLGDINDLRSLNQQCHERFDPQIPAIAKEIAAGGARMGLGAGIGGALGTGLGAIAAFSGVGFGAYAAYGGIASLLGGAGSGGAAAAGQFYVARRYVAYACMYGAVARVQARQPGRLDGVMVLPWAGSTQANAPVFNPVTREQVIPLRTQPAFGAPAPLPAGL